MKTSFVSPPILSLPELAKPSVVYTEASANAARAVLEKKGEEGREHPTAFPSRTLQAAERKYSAFEQEAVAVIFGLKKYRQYLLGAAFVLVTDHQALRGAFTRKDKHGRLARWLNLMAEFDFSMQHNPGTANAPADYMSQMNFPAARIEVEDEKGLAAELESFLIPNHIMSLAAGDTMIPSGHFEKWLGQVAQYLQNGRGVGIQKHHRPYAKQFAVSGGHLIRRRSGGARAVRPVAARQQIINSLHDIDVHWDARATSQFVGSTYCWPRLGYDVNLHVSTGEAFLKPKGPGVFKTGLRQPVHGLFSTFSLDFAGRLIRTKSGNRFFLMGVEQLTGWPILRATQNEACAVATACMEEDILDTFGGHRP